MGYVNKRLLKVGNPGNTNGLSTFLIEYLELKINVYRSIQIDARYVFSDK